jgi:hypothetical protein
MWYLRLERYSDLKNKEHEFHARSNRYGIVSRLGWCLGTVELDRVLPRLRLWHGSAEHGKPNQTSELCKRMSTMIRQCARKLTRSKTVWTDVDCMILALHVLVFGSTDQCGGSGRVDGWMLELDILFFVILCLTVFFLNVGIIVYSCY